MSFDAEFWVAIAFIIFMVIVWYAGGFTALLGSIDARGKRVRAELEEAKRLREEAAAVLADYTRRREEAVREADTIVAAAREEAERVAQEAHERMTDFVARRTAAAEAKIAQAETQAAQQVRDAAAEAAVRVSEAVLRDEMRGEAGEALVARSLQDVRAKLHA